MPAPPAADPAPDDYVSPAYLAARYQVTPRTIRNLYRRHELPGMRVGRQVHRALGVTYNNICLHLLRNESLFDEMPGSAPRRFKLSPSAIDLMARVKAAVDRRHRAHSLPTAPAGT